MRYRHSYHSSKLGLHSRNMTFRYYKGCILFRECFRSGCHQSVDFDAAGGCLSGCVLFRLRSTVMVLRSRGEMNPYYPDRGGIPVFLILRNLQYLRRNLRSFMRRINVFVCWSWRTKYSDGRRCVWPGASTQKGLPGVWSTVSFCCRGCCLKNVN